LLDAHALLWVATEPERLQAEAPEAIEDGTHDVLVRSVTAWEIAIKHSLGKLDLAQPAEIWIPEVLRRTGLESAPMELAATLCVIRRSRSPVPLRGDRSSQGPISVLAVALPLSQPLLRPYCSDLRCHAGAPP